MNELIQHHVVGILGTMKLKMLLKAVTFAVLCFSNSRCAAASTGHFPLELPASGNAVLYFELIQIGLD